MVRSKALALGLTLSSCAGSSPPVGGAPLVAPASAPSAPSVQVAPAAASVASVSAAWSTAHTPLYGRGFPDKVIALTWDDGPDANTLELAEYLESRRISATFFVVGAWIDGVSEDPGSGKGVFESGYEYLPILGDLVALGHRLGNHTLNHVVLREGAGARMIDHELRENQENVDPFLTNELRLFRAPGGGWGSFAASIVDADPYLSRMVGPVAWDVDRKDWDESLYCRGPRGTLECEHGGPAGGLRVKASVVATSYVASIEQAGHGIVLLHDRVGHVGSTYAVEVARAMIPQLEARGYVFAAPLLHFSPLAIRRRDAGALVAERAEADGIRLGDVNGDGHDDVCERSGATIACGMSMQTTPSASDRMPRTMFGVVTSVGATMPDGPIHLADVTGDGHADVCLAGTSGITCAASTTHGELGAFRSWARVDAAAARAWAPASLRFGDVDGDGRADACTRTTSGIVCAKNLGHRFDVARPWLSEMSDAHGWAARKYASSVQLADVDGDGKKDICGRGPRGIACAVSTGKGFGRLDRWSAGTDFADDGTWDENAAYTDSMRFGDLNGDGRNDVCGRSAAGVMCALSTGRGFARATVWLESDALDAQGFRRPELAATIQLGDVNGDGRADLCGRGIEGVVCGLSP